MGFEKLRQSVQATESKKELDKNNFKKMQEESKKKLDDFKIAFNKLYQDVLHPAMSEICDIINGGSKAIAARILTSNDIREYNHAIGCQVSRVRHSVHQSNDLIIFGNPNSGGITIRYCSKDKMVSKEYEIDIDKENLRKEIEEKANDWWENNPLN